MYSTTVHLTPSTGDHPRNALARAWRALFSAWDEPAEHSSIRALTVTTPAPTTDTPPAASPGAADGDDDDTTLRDLTPAPLYFGYDDAESALARLLEESAARAQNRAH